MRPVSERPVPHPSAERPAGRINSPQTSARRPLAPDTALVEIARSGRALKITAHRQRDEAARQRLDACEQATGAAQMLAAIEMRTEHRALSGVERAARDRGEGQ